MHLMPERTAGRPYPELFERYLGDHDAGCDAQCHFRCPAAAAGHLAAPGRTTVPVTFAAVLVALGLAGALSARIGGSNIRRAVLRVVIGGALGLAFTYGIGHLFGTAIG